MSLLNRGIVTFELLVFSGMWITVYSDISSFLGVPYCLDRRPINGTLDEDKKFFHCLNDEYNKSVVLYTTWDWVPGGKCAFYNNIANKIDYRLCDPSSGECPTEPYPSPESQIYSGCYKNDTKRKNMDRCNGILTPETETKCKECWQVAAFILFVVILLAIAAFLCWKLKDRIRKKLCNHGRGPRKNSDVSSQKEADEPMISGRGPRKNSDVSSQKEADEPMISGRGPRKNSDVSSQKEREPGTNSGRKSKENERCVDQPGQPQRAGNHPSLKYEIPSWCRCHRCREMETKMENLCCLKEPDRCRSLSHDFREHVLDRAMKEVGLSDDVNEKIRRKAYTLYTTRYVIDAGPSEKIVVPSCCMWKVRELHPDSKEKYKGFKG